MEEYDYVILISVILIIMGYHLQLKKYIIQGTAFDIFVPDIEEVKKNYSVGKISFPYWAKVWPSAIGLSQFLLTNNSYISNKKIIELAAGLGLPSIIASKFANDVTCSDHNIDAVRTMNKTIEHHGLVNCKSVILDWNDIGNDANADVVLLSDINYDPAEFAALTKVIDQFLSADTTIILSTPQRLMAKDFIKELLSYSIRNDEIIVDDTLISVFVLRK